MNVWMTAVTSFSVIHLDKLIKVCIGFTVHCTVLIHYTYKCLYKCLNIYVHILYIVHTQIHCTMYIVHTHIHYILYNVQCTSYKYPLYSVHCTYKHPLYSVHHTYKHSLYNVHTKVCSDTIEMITDVYFCIEFHII